MAGEGTNNNRPDPETFKEQLGIKRRVSNRKYGCAMVLAGIIWFGGIIAFVVWLLT